MFYMIEFLENDQGSGSDVPFINNGLMIFDIDVYEEEPVQEAIKWVHKNLGKQLFMMFRSPSNGLKFIIKTDVKTQDYGFHSFVYKRLAKQFSKKGLQVDTDDKTSNLNRGTYGSWDPDCYYNPECQELPVGAKLEAEWITEQEKENERRVAQRIFIADADFDEKYARNSLRIATQNIFNGTAPGSRNSNMYKVSAACFNCGFDVQEAYHQLSEMRAIGVADPDVTDLWKEANRHHKYWLANNGVANPKFYKNTPEAESALLKSSILASFK